MAIADIETHQRILAKTVGRYKDFAFGAARDVEIKVRFESGLQKGAARSFRTGTLTIGAQSDNDVVLLTEGAADHAASVAFSRSAFGVIASVTALSSDILVDGNALAAGETRKDIRLPLSVQIGKTGLRLEREAKAGEQAGPDARPARQPKGGGFIGLDLVTIAVIGLLAMVILGAVLSNLSGLQRDLSVKLNNDPVLPAQVAPVERPVDWTAQLADALAERTLDEWLRVSGDGAMIRVSGALPANEFAGLREVQAWYDAQRGTPIVVWDVERLQSLDVLPVISMVRISAPAEVYFENGESVRVGSSYVDGWRLAEITDDVLIFERGRERRSVKYREETQ